MTTTPPASCKPSRTGSHGSINSLLVNQSHISVFTARTLNDLPYNEDIPLFQRRDLEIGALLGRGRFSQVHAIRGIWSSSNSGGGTPSATAVTQQKCLYVMKHIQNKFFASRENRRGAKELTNAIADLVTEAMYLCKLKHPHIVQLRGLTLGGTSVLTRKGAVGSDYFILLDRMEETLDQRIHWTWRKDYGNAAEVNHTYPRQPLSLVLDKTRYAWQMADALSYLHDHQIIYRDLKPENVGFLLDTAAVETQNKYKLQLFDFGLARELEDPVTNESRLYTLSASGTW
jgi:serine/threonine protein kinase